MKSTQERIDALDTTLFDGIMSQTGQGCRRALLAVQRATTQRHASYTYLEIGSHLGGSIQPHLVDSRCRKIYSIDPRPNRQPDDRAPGAFCEYQDNSSQRMLDLLRTIKGGNVAKIECIEATSETIEPGRISTPPQLAFIDGEHTNRATLADYLFCQKVLDKNGTIVFHDFYIISDAVAAIHERLMDAQINHEGLMLEGSVYAVFFDREVVSSDDYLRGRRDVTRKFWTQFRIKRTIKRCLPKSF